VNRSQRLKCTILLTGPAFKKVTRDSFDGLLLASGIQAFTGAARRGVVNEDIPPGCITVDGLRQLRRSLPVFNRAL
jgi:hypothetical protein